MANSNLLPMPEPEQIFHQPGEHNQKAHGGGKGGGTTRSAAEATYEGITAQNAPLSAAMEGAIGEYTGPTGNFEVVNGVARGQLSVDDDPQLAREMNRNIASLDAAVASSHLTADVNVFRGLEGDLGLKVGDTITDGGFASVTLLPSHARSFATRTPGTGTLFQISLPKGAKAVKGEKSELELILPRNSSFVVRGVKPSRVGNVQIVELSLG